LEIEIFRSIYIDNKLNSIQNPKSIPLFLQLQTNVKRKKYNKNAHCSHSQNALQIQINQTAQTIIVFLDPKLIINHRILSINPTPIIPVINAITLNHKMVAKNPN